jgi:hypothetical protein
MSAPINDGGPAFPSAVLFDQAIVDSKGMTLRQYAAIKLRVPDSGTDWLDEMIRKSNRDYFAAAALQGITADGGGASWDDDAKNAFKAADAMLKAMEAKP